MERYINGYTNEHGRSTYSSKCHYFVVVERRTAGKIDKFTRNYESLTRSSDFHPEANGSSRELGRTLDHDLADLTHRRTELNHRFG